MHTIFSILPFGMIKKCTTIVSVSIYLYKKSPCCLSCSMFESEHVLCSRMNTPSGHEEFFFFNRRLGCLFLRRWCSLWCLCLHVLHAQLRRKQRFIKAPTPYFGFISEHMFSHSLQPNPSIHCGTWAHNHALNITCHAPYTCSSKYDLFHIFKFMSFPPSGILETHNGLLSSWLDSLKEWIERWVRSSRRTGFDCWSRPFSTA